MVCPELGPVPPACLLKVNEEDGSAEISALYWDQSAGSVEECWAPCAAPSRVWGAQVGARSV